MPKVVILKPVWVEKNTGGRLEIDVAFLRIGYRLIIVPFKNHALLFPLHICNYKYVVCSM
jgi:hypothetical protein